MKYAKKRIGEKMKKSNIVKRNQVVLLALLVCLCAGMLAGCHEEPVKTYEWKELAGLNEVASEEAATEEPESESEEFSEEEPEAATEENTEEVTEEATEETTEEVTEEASGEETAPTPETGGGRLVVIDAGHQIKGNSEKEPIGPGATETKAKVTGGATGGTTGQKEYELNLAVAFILRDELVARGYEVIMVRESNEVNISNSERAAVANNAGADAFIRIHANGSENSEASGTETLCQTAQNPYNASLYPAGRKLSECVLAGVVAQTGFKNRGVKETDTMSGINWCSVPTTIVEMGFLSNPTEDSLLFTEEYRRKVAIGIADGLDSYFVE